LTGRIHIDRAARAILDGGVVAYPTEAVYGLGCLPLDPDAVERLLRIKGRRWRKGFLVIAAAIDQLEPLVDLDAAAKRDEILASWPGPVTWTLPARPGVPQWLTGARATLAVRVTAHPIARALCRRTGLAIVSTSANRSGHPPHRRLLALRRELGAAVDYVLPGPLGGSARPSRIRDGATGEVLRPG
jgi:L-threonylcarbamoyladenylate synthase